MDFFKFFNIHFSLKRKYKYILIVFVFAFIIWNLLVSFGYCSNDVIENVDLVVLTDSALTTNSADPSSLRLVQSNGNVCYYFTVLTGFEYTIESPSGGANMYVGKSDTLVSKGDDVDVVVSGSTSKYTFIPESDGFYYYVSRVSWGNNPPVVTRVSLSKDSSMSQAVGGLITGLPSSDIWGVIGKATPFILVCVLVTFGTYIINRNVDRISKCGSSGDSSISSSNSHQPRNKAKYKYYLKKRMSKRKS